MDPITGGTGIVNKAAEFGMFAFLAVIVILGMGWLIYTLISQAKERENKADLREESMAGIVQNNTLAMSALGPILQSICKDLSDHDRRVTEAVDEIAQIGPSVRKIETRTEDIQRMLLSRDRKSM